MQQLTLVLPALHWPYPTALPPLHTPGLNHLLHWGRPQAQPAQHSSQLLGAYLWTGSLLQHARSTLKLSEHQPAFWCSPLSWRMGMHSAQAINGAALTIGPEEAARWCAELSDFFTDQHWHFYPYRPDLWLLACPQEPQWQAANILDLGSHIHNDDKPQGDGAATLLQTQTEIQMLLHNHPLNQQRKQQGRLPVNGVWCWRDIQGSADPHPLLVTDSAWATDDSTRPRLSARHWGELQASGTPPLLPTVVFDDTLLATAQLGDVDAYAARLQHLDACWFIPLWQALRTGSLKQLAVVSEQCHWLIRKPRIHPFWRTQPIFQGRC